MEFALGVNEISAAQQKAVLDKVQDAGHDVNGLEKLTDDEVEILKGIAGKQQALTLHASNIEALAGDTINGLAAVIERGKIGLRSASVLSEAEALHVLGVEAEERERMMNLNRTLAVEA